MLRISTLLLILAICGFSQLRAQTTFHSETIRVAKSKIVSPQTAPVPFDVQILNKEAPLPAGDSYKAFLMEQKIKSREKFPLKEISSNAYKSSAPEPAIGEGIYMYREYFNGAIVVHTGGIPNDNTLAISNDGVLLGAINSVLWAYDTKKDTLMFDKSIVPLLSFVKNINRGHAYDPKLIYDEQTDRFIMVFLQANTPANSGIIVCFSSSNDPRDPWYTYELPGNPLNNNRWTDFPAISLTEDELFITGNLIIPDVSWQVGFDGSVIWQLKKEDGFANADSIRTRFYSDIRTNGRLIRNLHAVNGVESAAPAAYFLSNRNFDISNDSIFVLHIDGKLEDPATNLNITIGQSNIPYGVPPNGRQYDTDQSDPTKGLQTNDARVLGAITNGDWIQFVSTTVNPQTGLAAIYHGKINQPASSEQSISAKIIGHNKRDYAYPNIAFAGNEVCDYETIIGFDYTSPLDDPGVAALYFGNDSTYSDVLTVKQGEDYVNKHSDSYERWGDYFGIQRKYNEPGKVWIGGFYGISPRNSGTWFNELSSPDEDILVVSHQESGKSQFCEGELNITVSGGVPPYLYSFNGGADSTINSIRGLCNKDTVYYSATDSRGCVIQDTVYIKSDVNSVSGVYPNPFISQIVTQFVLENDGMISAFIYNEKGQMIEKLIETKALKGLNELRFNLDPLSAGNYIVQVVSGEDQILVRKVFKVE